MISSIIKGIFGIAKFRVSRSQLGMHSIKDFKHTQYFMLNRIYIYMFLKQISETKPKKSFWNVLDLKFWKKKTFIFYIFIFGIDSLVY